MYLCWRKRRGFSRELVFKEEIDRKLCAFGNYWLVLKGTIFRLSGITAYSSFQKSSHCTEVSKLDWHKMLDPLEAIWGQTFQTGLSKLEEFSCVEVDVISLPVFLKA
ncbi:uncharacterized protein LOC127805981 isoform X6 [Diospyros lotus]|uniref:uncharacterized protein LOC127805981 isoform X6 n=1 Tax=Diospyros lotus TaxID=55363 RepID=UPI00225BC590|nr:uncharacterized protein LOC127805981 isoform X6 [Diospyros lotus]